MAQTSTTLSGERSHKSDVTGTDISFNATGATYKITSTSTALNNFAVRDLITVTGTTNNNSTFTVKEVTDANNLVVEEIVTTETSDGSTTTTLDHTGFVTDKAKGDGYYSQPDGVHTVAYQVLNRGDSTDDFNGTVKMQEVLLGERRGDQIRILEGLQPGDVILRIAKEGRPGTLSAAEPQPSAAEQTKAKT